MTHIRPTVMLTLAIVLVVLSGAGFAQERPSPPANREGITVHGHWVIQVENPDGTVAVRREFENALMNTGRSLLAAVLGHESSVGWWRINIQNSTPAGSVGGPCNFNGAESSCDIWEDVPNFNPETSRNSKTLIVSVPKDANGFPVGTLELSGSIVASRTSGIGFVTTSFRYCFASVSPQACSTNQAGSGEAPLTSKQLPSSIPVAAGQVVRVWVTLSFS
jgi:hypothetical protein